MLGLPYHEMLIFRNSMWESAQFINVAQDVEQDYEE